MSHPRCWLVLLLPAVLREREPVEGIARAALQRGSTSAVPAGVSAEPCAGDDTAMSEIGAEELKPLVYQYLVKTGLSKSAKAFAKEVGLVRARV